jgi:hypothetical protein
VGLDIAVGIQVNDDESVIAEMLARAGAGPWTEPRLRKRQLLEGDLWTYSTLHTLRRIAAHLAATNTLPNPVEPRSAADDPVLESAYNGFGGDPGPFDHLLFHSDSDGYYVPVDFAPVLVDKRLTGACLGSSVRLLDETRRIASALGLPEDLAPESAEILDACSRVPATTAGWRRYGTESYACLQLLRAASHSIATGAAIVFWLGANHRYRRLLVLPRAL